VGRLCWQRGVNEHGTACCNQLACPASKGRKAGWRPAGRKTTGLPVPPTSKSRAEPAAAQPADCARLRCRLAAARPSAVSRYLALFADCWLQMTQPLSPSAQHHRHPVALHQLSQHAVPPSAMFAAHPPTQQAQVRGMQKRGLVVRRACWLLPTGHTSAGRRGQGRALLRSLHQPGAQLLAPYQPRACCCQLVGCSQPPAHPTAHQPHTCDPFPAGMLPTSCNPETRDAARGPAAALPVSTAARPAGNGPPHHRTWAATPPSDQHRTWATSGHRECVLHHAGVLASGILTWQAACLSLLPQGMAQ